MSFYLLLGAIFVIAGCAAIPSGGREVTIVWHRTKSHADADAICRRLLTNAPNQRIRGCSWDEGKICHIVSPEIRFVTDYKGQETLGHEVKHCFDGEWDK